MAGVAPSRLDRRVNPLDIIRHNVGELSGYDTLAFELIQNADDAEDSSKLRFDVRKDALWVEDDGGFSDCGDQSLDESECPFIDSRGHRCDFHSFRALSGADKRDREDTTGAFGIGFTAVYQITDHPEIISGARHWVVDESRKEGQIEERASDPAVDGTRIVLPWARDPDTEIRKRLRVPAVAKNVSNVLLQELQRVVPAALVFARSLERIEVARDGKSVLVAERQETEEGLSIACNGEMQTWRLIEGDFHDEARALRVDHANSIEPSRTADVTVAIPIKGDAGGICVTLPTKERFPLPWLVNADFYPSADRRHLAMNADHKVRWNSAAMECAAGLVAGELDGLPELLGADRLWQALAEARDLAGETSVEPIAEALGSFWRHLQEALPWAEIVPTSAGGRVTPEEARFLRSPDEEAAVSVLERLGLGLVDLSLRRHQNILRAAQVPFLEVKHVASALRDAGLNGELEFSELPEALQKPDDRAQLWAEVALLLGRLKGDELGPAQDALDEVAFLPKVGGSLVSPEALWNAEADTVELFHEVNEDIPFVDSHQLRGAQALTDLCDPFGPGAALDELEAGVSAEVSMAGGRALVAWFAARETDLEADDHERLGELPIFPSLDGCRPRPELVLPGDFKDPLGLAILVDDELAKEHGAFLARIGFPELSFEVYALRRLPAAFEHANTTDDQRRSAALLLAERRGEIEDAPQAHEILAQTAIVLCTDGSWRLPAEVYFDTAAITQVLGDDPPRAAAWPEHPAAGHELLAWLGVADEPRPADVVAQLDTISSQAISDRRVKVIQAIFEWLSEKWPGLDEEDRSAYEGLREMSWLVDEGTTQWRSADQVYATFQRYLFASQETFLGLSRQQAGAAFLDWLGVRSSPTPEQVVAHLLHAGASSDEINDEVYTYLNANADHPALEDLRGEPCLRTESGWLKSTDVFFGDHPFGRWRYRLDGAILERRRLLDRLAVRDTPDHDDAVRVMGEISALASQGPLSETDQAVLLECWRMVQAALLAGDLDDSVLERLASQAVVADRDGELRSPVGVFFEDLIGLSDELAGLEGRVISPPLGAAEAMRGAGVRDLSSVAEARIVEMGRTASQSSLAERAHERKPLIQRIVAHETDAPWVEMEARLDAVNWASVPELKVSWRINLPEGGEVVGDARSAHALWDRAKDALYVVENGAGPVWEGVSIELLRAALPGAPAGMALGIARALGAETFEEATAALDAARVPRLAEEIDADVTPGEMSDLAAGSGNGEEGGMSEAADGDGEPATTEGFDEGTEPESVDAGGSPTASGGDSPEGEEPDVPAGSDREPSGEQGSPLGKQGAPPARGRSGDSKSERKPQPSQARMRSYVVAPEDEYAPSPDDSDGEADQRRREEIDRAGVDAVLAMEAEAGRTPEEQDHNNPGYDVMSSSSSRGADRVIEVKSCGGPWGATGVSMSPAQFAMARNHRDQYWLYVVENALDPDRRVIWMIQDPYGRATNFMFDDGWRGVAEAYGDEELLSIAGGRG